MSGKDPKPWLSELASHLRDVHDATGLNGKEFAARLAWPESKVSRIRRAVMTPSIEDIQQWAVASGAGSGQLQALLETREAALQSLRTPSDDLPEIDFHPGVHEPHSFICVPDVCVITVRARPPRAIAGALLEDVGDWMRALRGLPDTELPPAVVNMVTALHDATCQWVDWLDAGEHSRRRAAPAGPDPEPPRRGPA